MNLRLRHPITSQQITGSEFVFADDTLSLRVVPDQTAATALDILARDDTAFDGAMAEGGWRQNARKKEIVANLRRRGETRRFADQVQDSQGRVLPAARHLGGLFSYSGSDQAEVRRRCTADRKGWHELGRFWASRTPLRLRRALFISKVVEAAQSGVLSYAFTDRQYGQLDSVLSTYCRVLLRGRVAWRGDQHMECLSNLEVLARVRILPSKLED